MDDNGQRSEYGPGGYMSDFENERNTPEMMSIPQPTQAQNGAYQCAYPSPSNTSRSSETSPLGEPLAIEDVARLLGCSAWTVRQRYLSQGLPYLQARPRGKLVFFRDQVVAWTLKRQRQLKGGLLR